MADAETRAQPIRIDASKTPDGKVLLISEDEKDRFFKSFRETVAACQCYESLQEHGEAFWEGLVPCLQSWLHEHKGKALAGYLTFRESGFLFVIPCFDVFDENFESQVTDLELQIARDCPQYCIEALEIPAAEDHLDAFVAGNRILVEFSLG